MAAESLTPRQAQVLQFITRSIRQRGYPPTRNEISSAFGFASPNAAESHLRALARKQAIQLVKGQSRGIMVPSTRGDGDSGLPLIGQVAAGTPITAIENVERQLEVPAGLFRPAADYLLRVRGDSMRDAAILDGDLIAVHRTPEAQDGQIVVARIDGEVTVKRLRRRPGRPLALLPANPDYQPMVFQDDPGELVLEGLCVGVLRGLGG